MTRILSISSVSVLLTRWCRPRQAPSSFWNSSWCMIWLICSVSFWSISAIIASMRLDRVVRRSSSRLASACSASVLDRALDLCRWRGRSRA